jgi:PTH1 family peptidyl-tRNA hydrolase
MATFLFLNQTFSVMNKFLIVGLGNIGDEYANTRHNIGFMVLDTIAKENNLKFSSNRLADCVEYKFKGKTLILIKPSTYMNLSGKAVNYWLQAEKISIENLLIITDDIALPLGLLRLKGKGSDGGHNGLKNIQETLNTPNYARLRFGVGNEFSKGRQADYVLGKWNVEEEKIVNERIQIAKEMIQGFATIGLQRTMTAYNNK